MSVNGCRLEKSDERYAQREPTELEIIKGKLRRVSRMATAAMVVEKFRDIPRMYDLTEVLTEDVKAGLADLAKHSV